MGRMRKHISKKNLARLKVNTVVKAVILAEMLFWSGWNFIMPLFSLYVTKMPHGTIQNAATSVSFYFLTRVIFGLLTGRYLNGRGMTHKFFFTIFGIGLVSISYLGMGFASHVTQLYFFYCVIGIGLGMASPAKNSLFSSNVNKEKASLTWSVYDAGVFLSMALATAVAGSIANTYGFKTLFILAAIINCVAILPYLMYLEPWKKELSWASLTSKKLHLPLFQS